MMNLNTLYYNLRINPAKEEESDNLFKITKNLTDDKKIEPEKFIGGVPLFKIPPKEFKYKYLLHMNSLSDFNNKKNVFIDSEERHKKLHDLFKIKDRCQKQGSLSREQFLAMKEIDRVFFGDNSYQEKPPQLTKTSDIQSGSDTLYQKEPPRLIKTSDIRRPKTP